MRLRPLLALAALLPAAALHAQQAPPSPEKPWPVPASPLPPPAAPRPALDPAHVYSLAELVDFAERNNPQTRVLWERAKQKAAAVGIARSALFPALAVAATPSINQYSLFSGRFYREDTALLPAIASLNWTVFDFGARASRIDQARATLLAADFSFNDAHRQIVFDVTEAYYRLLDAMSQAEAARAAVADASAIRQSLEVKLANGLATLPDVVEARAASAQALYQLASVSGLEAVARGNLATALGISPLGAFSVEDLSRVPLPPATAEPVDLVLDRALAQRPDLQASLALVRASSAAIGTARSAFYPQVSVYAEWGHSNGFGEQYNLGTPAESRIFPYQVQVRISWSLFDGGARRRSLESARSSYREAQAQAETARDRVENELWRSWARLKTSQESEKAAAALLEASQQSFAAASEAFTAGVKTFLDVTTSQRNLARARAVQASARLQVLSDYADFAFRAGDALHPVRP